MPVNSQNIRTEPSERSQELSKTLNVPIIQPLGTPDVKKGTDVDPIIAVCGQCDLQLREYTTFMCPHNNCPCFSKTYLHLVPPAANTTVDTTVKAPVLPPLAEPPTPPAAPVRANTAPADTTTKKSTSKSTK